jgi:hypothetical protein
MTKELFEQIVAALLPEMEETDARKALVESALYGSFVLHKIEWQGAAYPFTVNLINELINFGEAQPGQPAVTVLLTQLKAQVGLDRQEKLAALLAALSQPPAPKPAQTTGGQPIPRPLLKYLCNRSDQEKVISRAFRDHLPARRQRPIVCLIHGDVNENYIGFLERLKLRIFPKYLHLTPGQTITDKGMAPPARVSQSSDFWEALSPAFLGYGGGLPEEIKDAVMAHREPLMLKLHLDTEACKDSKEQLFKHLLEFWQAWPDLTDGRILINCVCLSYNRYPGAGLLDFTSRSRRKLNEQLKEWLTEKFNAEDYKQIIAVAVPELHAVSAQEVLAWTDDAEVKQACAISPDDVKKLFQRPELRNPEGKIPTEMLYPELAELLKGPVEPVKN